MALPDLESVTPDHEDFRVMMGWLVAATSSGAARLNWCHEAGAGTARAETRGRIPQLGRAVSSEKVADGVLTAQLFGRTGRAQERRAPFTFIISLWRARALAKAKSLPDSREALRVLVGRLAGARFAEGYSSNVERSPSGNP